VKHATMVWISFVYDTLTLLRIGLLALLLNVGYRHYTPEVYAYI
jgi:hypothetical protein